MIFKWESTFFSPRCAQLKLPTDLLHGDHAVVVAMVRHGRAGRPRVRVLLVRYQRIRVLHTRGIVRAAPAHVQRPVTTRACNTTRSPFPQNVQRGSGLLKIAKALH